MPMHDWTGNSEGLYPSFHIEWIVEIGRTLNRGILPPGFYAAPEKHAAGYIPDVLTLQRSGDNGSPSTATRPKARLVSRVQGVYLKRKSRIAIRATDGDELVAVIELVSPGNRNNIHSLRAFVRKVWGLLRQRVNLLIVDPFPPNRRAPHGLHAVIFRRAEDHPYELPADRPLTQVAYASGASVTAFLEPLAVGEPLADMPVYLGPDTFVELPLEATYQAAWEGLPSRIRELVEHPPAR